MRFISLTILLSFYLMTANADVVVFGDSLSDPQTYSSPSNTSWVERLQTVYGISSINYAKGGAGSGAANDNFYTVNSSTLFTKGALGQVSDYLNSSASSNCNSAARGHVIWVGTNDMIIGAQLDPFSATLAPGVTGTVGVTALIQNFRNAFLPTHTNQEYYEAVINSYTVPNIGSAIDSLQGCGAKTIMVTGLFDLGHGNIDIPDPATVAEKQLATHATKCLNRGLKNLVSSKNIQYPSTSVIYTDISSIVPVPFDEIHLDTTSQTEVLNKMLACDASGTCAANTANDPAPSKCNLTL